MDRLSIKRPISRKVSQEIRIDNQAIPIGPSAPIAASLVIAVIRTDQDQRVLGDVTSAHVRSLQGDHSPTCKRATSIR